MQLTNGELDNDMHDSAVRGNIRYQVMEVIFEDDKFYLSDSIQPGNRICWIGDISYWEDSQGNVILLPSTDLCFSID